ncbi:MAG TPA: hypothetical protein VHO48_01095 [Anaerolineaceae bacterium]|nr:hypothetical protein [Anaerolineaceae bacterium]
MRTEDFLDIPPRRKPFKRAVNQIVMFVLGRALQSLSHSDPLIQWNVRSWPENFTLTMLVRPDGGSMSVSRTANGQLRYRGSRLPADQADVLIYIKNVDVAFALFTGQLGADVAYAQHAMCARGDLSYTVSVVRVLDVAETYLFPAVLARRLMKELPPIPFLRKHALRLKTYALGILFGI